MKFGKLEVVVGSDVQRDTFYGEIWDGVDLVMAVVCAPDGATVVEIYPKKDGGQRSFTLSEFADAFQRAVEGTRADGPEPPEVDEP